MQIEISKDTSRKVDVASKSLGIRKKDLIDRALLIYLDMVQKEIELRKEFEAWEKLSDEDLINFEKSL